MAEGGEKVIDLSHACQSLSTRDRVPDQALQNNLHNVKIKRNIVLTKLNNWLSDTKFENNNKKKKTKKIRNKLLEYQLKEFYWKEWKNSFNFKNNVYTFSFLTLLNISAKYNSPSYFSFAFKKDTPFPIFYWPIIVLFQVKWIPFEKRRI